MIQAEETGDDLPRNALGVESLVVMGFNFKRVVDFIAPSADKEDDGRDKWPSRAAFVLAAMGGAVGLGNLLRYPSVVFANNGLQWFIPYLIALFFLGIPVLCLEICIGQAYRGSVVVAFNGINKHTKGVGLAVIMNGFIVATYYVPILAWIMHYFRCSFESPLPWSGRGQEFYMQDVITNDDPIVPEGSGYVEYPGTGFVGETVGWAAFMWMLVWLCMFKGVGTTGRVVYFTMGLPVIMIIIILGRSVSLPTPRLVSSIISDTLIIALCNSLYEIVGGFAVFGVIGFLGYSPDDSSISLSTFTVGFLTYPLALAEMPGANVWAVLFFLTLAVLGLSSAFALSESLVTLICDCGLGRKFSRVLITTVIILLSFLLSLIYCTKFGFYLLDAVDTWINNLSLIFVVWCECVAATTLYRYKDVVGQIGWTGYLVYNIGYVLSMVLGVAIGHAVSPAAGAGVGFGIFIASNILAIILSKSPDSRPPGLFGKNNVLSKMWWFSFYSFNQLRRDLNIVVAGGKRWNIPVFWGFVLRYISAPILAIIVSFAFPLFYTKRNDPLHIFSFASACGVMCIVAAGFILPRWFDVFVPPEKLHLSDTFYAPQVVMAPLEVHHDEVIEHGEHAGEGHAEPYPRKKTEAQNF
uniref:Sodium-and chloride-dependent GABA transporter 1 n=1 Tax=Fusarium oxysporum (strain Fo5176) TaxID=660025 RepID=A0A0D2XTF4_FUSOF